MSRNKNVSFAALLVSLTLAFSADVLAQQSSEDSRGQETPVRTERAVPHENSDMKLDADQLLSIVRDHEATRESAAAESVSLRAMMSYGAYSYTGQSFGQSFSLAFPKELNLTVDYMPYLKIRAHERDQGDCSNCYVWAATGAMEIAFANQFGKESSEPLSIQFFNSCQCPVDAQPCETACALQTPGNVADFYKEKKFAIPWNNYRAYFQDKYKAEPQPSSTFCADINQNTDINLKSIDLEKIGTSDANMSPSEAIDKIKNVLIQPSGVVFGMFWPSNDDFKDFVRWWNTSEDTDVYNPDDYCNKPEPKGGGLLSGHFMLIVGYHDVPGERYWVVLNSLGTSHGKHPNGTFRLKMDMNYKCTLKVKGEDAPVRQFATLNVKYNEGALDRSQMPPSYSLDEK